MILESRVRSKDLMPGLGRGVRKSAVQTVTRWRSTLPHAPFLGEHTQATGCAYPTSPLRDPITPLSEKKPLQKQWFFLVAG
jgi:hypothetical protein